MVPVAFMPHHMGTLSSCNGTSWNNMGFSATPVILRVQIYSEMKISITTKQNSGGPISPANLNHKV